MTEEKKKINLGCSYTKLDGYINIDRNPLCEPDIVRDIERGLPFDDCSIDEVMANDYLEHTVDFIFVMNEIARVLKVGGKLKARFPNWKTEAIHNPTHNHILTVQHFNVFTPRWINVFTPRWTRNVDEANAVFKKITYETIKASDRCPYCDLHHPFDTDHVILEKSFHKNAWERNQR
jgi:SAM-dependent methyltransferase